MTNQDWIDLFDNLTPPHNDTVSFDHGKDRQEYRLTRLACADWLEERGLDDLAEYQRWLAEYLKCPLRLYEGKIYAWTVSYESQSYCRLPQGIFDNLPSARTWPGRKRALIHGRYRSRHEAEIKLFLALSKLSIIGGAI